MIDWMQHARKLRNIKRCGNMRTVCPMTVAEHSYYVALLALDIAEDVRERGHVFSDGEVLKKALLHDMEESIIGDIPYPVKRSSRKLMEALEEVKENTLYEFFPDKIADECIEAKKGTVGRVVAMADYVELYLYCAEEKLAGNREKYLDEIMLTCKQIFKGKLWEDIVQRYFDEIDTLLQKGESYELNKRIADCSERGREGQSVSTGIGHVEPSTELQR